MISHLTVTITRFAGRKQWPLLLCCYVAGGGWMLFAQAPDAPEPPAAAFGLAVQPTPQAIAKAVSSTQFLRNLLSMTPEQRERALAKKSDKQRAYLRDKLDEYDRLNPADREVRFQALELRAYLKPLLKMSAEKRAAAMAAVPEEDRQAVEDRLRRWDKLPAELRKDVLEHERTLFYVVRDEARSNQFTNLAVPLSVKKDWDDRLRVWQALSSERRQQIYVQFYRFFELSPKERNRVLESLTVQERQQAEASLRVLEQLPPDERKSCLDSVFRVTQLPAERQEQLILTIEQWKKMSAPEKRAWKTVMPVLLPGMEPPIPGRTNRPPPVGVNKIAPPMPGVAADSVKR